jgi:hypothetical protein
VSLDVTGCNALSEEALMEVLQGSWRTLRELLGGPRWRGSGSGPDFASAAPFLEVWEPGSSAQDPYSQQLAQYLHSSTVPEQELNMNGEPLSAWGAMFTVVDLALRRRFNPVRFRGNTLGPACVPKLAQLLHGEGTSCERGRRKPSVTDLIVDGRGRRTHDSVPFPCGARLLDAASVPLLCAALRTNRSLTALELSGLQLFREPAVALTLLKALEGHPRLRELRLSRNAIGPDDDAKGAAPVVDGAALGAALGALVAANGPLIRLYVDDNALRDDGLGPLADALAVNTNMEDLVCRGNHLSAGFVRGRLSRGVRANSALLGLDVGHKAAAQLHALVKARYAAHLEALRKQPVGDKKKEVKASSSEDDEEDWRSDWDDSEWDDSD